MNCMTVYVHYVTEREGKGKPKKRGFSHVSVIVGRVTIFLNMKNKNIGQL